MNKRKISRTLVTLLSTVLIIIASFGTTIFAADSTAKSYAKKFANYISQNGGIYYNTTNGKITLTYSESSRQIVFKYTENLLYSTVSFTYDVYGAKNITQLTYEGNGFSLTTKNFNFSKYSKDTTLQFSTTSEDANTSANIRAKEAFSEWDNYLQSIGYSLKKIGASKYTTSASKCTNHNSLENTLTPATTKKNGFYGKKCEVCGYTKGSKIPRIDYIELFQDTYIADGKKKEPKVTVYDIEGDVIASKYYTVSYSNNKAVGTATVNVTFTGSRYSGKLTEQFTIKSPTKYTYTIRFDGNGSTSGYMDDMTCKVDKSYSLEENEYSKVGYSFVSWNTKKDGSGKTYKNFATVKNLTSKAGNTVTLYAQWKANTYSIKFAGNGATSGSMSSMKCSYGKKYTLRDNTFKKSGYTFAGWNTKKDGSGDSYADEESIKNLTSKNGNTITLYAQWKSSSKATSIVSINKGNNYDQLIISIKAQSGVSGYELYRSTSKMVNMQRLVALRLQDTSTMNFLQGLPTIIR